MTLRLADGPEAGREIDWDLDDSPETIINVPTRRLEDGDKVWENYLYESQRNRTRRVDPLSLQGSGSVAR